MTDQLLDILKIAFLALLYLFFIRVLWVVSSEVRATRANANARVSTGVVAGPTGQATQASQATHLAADPLPVVVPGAPAPIATRKAPRGKRGNVGRLVVIEPRARRGSSYAVGPEITLGRSPGCTVQIADDAFVSNLHARVFVADGYLLAEDVGSTNGTYLNGVRLSQPRPITRGDRLQVGNTVLEAQ